MIRLLMTVLLCALTGGAVPAAAVPPLPEARGTHPPVPEKREAPKELVRPELADRPEVWAPDEIVAAQRACISAVADHAYDLEPLEPIREGLCGAPAPVSLHGLPGESELRLMPPATLTCAMSARLREWVVRVLQPTARARLGSPVVKLRLMGTYTCRRRYAEANTRLSQHALAKAIDIGAFQTADGQVISVLNHWPGDDERAAFLRDIHTGACQIFDTVLGPRANEAHANHFHFDIGSGGVCE